MVMNTHYSVVATRQIHRAKPRQQTEKEKNFTDFEQSSNVSTKNHFVNNFEDGPEG